MLPPRMTVEAHLAPRNEISETVRMGTEINTHITGHGSSAPMRIGFMLRAAVDEARIYGTRPTTEQLEDDPRTAAEKIHDERLDGHFSDLGDELEKTLDSLVDRIVEAYDDMSKCPCPNCRADNASNN